MASRRYFAAKNASFNDKKAQVYGARLGSLLKEHGALSPEVVVTAARSGADPLHPYFQWDDIVAAENYRKMQARNLLGSIVVKVRGEEVRAFEHVSVQMQAKDEDTLQTVSVYLWQGDVRKDEALHESNLGQILRWLIHFKERYRNIKELGPVIAAIEEVEQLQLVEA